MRALLDINVLIALFDANINLKAVKNATEASREVLR